jgi:hypothetical protein
VEKIEELKIGNEMITRKTFQLRMIFYVLFSSRQFFFSEYRPILSKLAKVSKFLFIQEEHYSLKFTKEGEIPEECFKYKNWKPSNVLS